MTKITITVESNDVSPGAGGSATPGQIPQGSGLPAKSGESPPPEVLTHAAAVDAINAGPGRNGQYGLCPNRFVREQRNAGASSATWKPVGLHRNGYSGCNRSLHRETIDEIRLAPRQKQPAQNASGAKFRKWFNQTHPSVNWVRQR